MTDASSQAAAMRRSYEHATLDESAVAPDWLTQFRSWFDAAVADAAVIEANAMQLATVDADGQPNVRTVLAKGFDEGGVVFYTNYDSVKGAELAANPRAAVVFAWLAQERQVRLNGRVSRVSAEETVEYFRSRPRGSQLGAWASPQSQVVASREVLAAAERAVHDRFADVELLDPPPYWGGYRLEPESVEFWQGRRDRLHDRVRYRRRDKESWAVERLAP